MFEATRSWRQVPKPALARWIGAGVLALAAGAAMPAWAQGGPGGPGPHGPGMGAPGMMMGDLAHMERGIDRLLDGLGVTEAQRSQIRQIVQAAAPDMRAQHEAGRVLREKGLQVLMAPTVDAQAAESLRQQMLVQHDQVTKRMLQTLLDVGTVLTPEQRTKLGERMKLRGEMMRDRMQRAPRSTDQKG